MTIRLLLLAPCADPDDVGEAWVAAQWVRHLSRSHDVTLVTWHRPGHPSAEEAFPGVRSVEWSPPAWWHLPERFDGLLKPWYPLWYRRTRRWITHALARGETFDIALQPVPVAMRYPSPLRGLGIPYVLGPVGGGLTSPPGFSAEDTSPWYVGLRRLDGWRMRHDRALRDTYAGAEVVLGIAPYVRRSLASVPLKQLEFMSETAVNDLPSPPPPSPDPSEDAPVRLLFVGRVIRTKGVRDAIRALALLRDRRLVFDVVGDGFDREACESLAGELGVADRVHFHGRRPRDEVDAFYRMADIFVYPSYREPGGNAPFEAMSHGLPVVICDRGGPSHAVPEDCGLHVAARSPSQYARDLAQAVARLVDDPHLRQSMGAAARRHVSAHGTWARRAEEMSIVISDVARNNARSVDPPLDRVAASVIIPAHNEARTLGRLLSELTGPGGEDLEIVVVCNGCTDSTAEVARSFGPAVRVLEQERPSKSQALRAGDQAATRYPRLYVDADVELGLYDVRDLVAALDEGTVLACAPERELRLAGSTAPVRSYYTLWSALPQVRNGLFGRGVIAVNEPGHHVLQGLPSVMSDDLLMSGAFEPHQRRVVETARVVVHPPRSLADLLRRRVRVVTGNAELDGLTLRRPDDRTSAAVLLATVLAQPRLLPHLPLFVVVTLVARTRASTAVSRGDFSTWLRDESSRT